MNEIPQETLSASQRDIQTVAFNSNEDVSVKTEYIPQPQSNIENVPPPKENVPETRFVQVKPEVKPEIKPEPKTDIKEKAETNSSGTQDRINYDFSNEE